MLTSVKTNRGTEETLSDHYRICQCDFKVEFVTAASQPGKNGYVYSENLFKPSNITANFQNV